MTQTTLAILARFDGDRAQAVEYCCTMMEDYPALRDEYREHKNEILVMEAK